MRFGEVEARGVALTPEGRDCYDAAIWPTTGPRDAAWGAATSPPPTPARSERAGVLPRRRPIETRCLRGLPAGIGGGDLPVQPRYRRTVAAAEEDRYQSTYSRDWMAGQIGHHIHDPYELYEKVASS